MEVRVAVVGSGVDRGRLGVGLTADLLGALLGFRLDLGQLALPLAVDPRRFALSLRTELLRDTLALGDHTGEHVLLDLFDVVQPLEAKIEKLDAKIGRSRRGGLGFEDFVAIPDLAAGMIGEALSVTRSRDPGRPGEYGPEQLSPKSNIISDWFWHRSGRLKKICILVGPTATKGQFGIGELNSELR